MGHGVAWVAVLRSVVVVKGVASTPSSAAPVAAAALAAAVLAVQAAVRAAQEEWDLGIAYAAGRAAPGTVAAGVGRAARHILAADRAALDAVVPVGLLGACGCG